jgi:glycosyltransferase involved in cell wall biosynthesis
LTRIIAVPHTADAIMHSAERSGTGDQRGAIQVSVVIPTYNRSRLLRACLEALGRQTEPPQHFEVIVAVDGSTDDTRAMLATLATPYKLSVSEQPNQGPGTARNRGALTAQGEYCLFLDDDIVADPDLIRAHLLAQRAIPDSVTIGRVDTVLGHGADGFARYLAARWREHYRSLETAEQPLSFTNCWGANLCIPRQAFHAAGGFATDMPSIEDIELGHRLVRHGLRLTYVRDAIGRQHYEKPFATIVADSEKNGESAVELVRRHPSTLPDVLLGAFNAQGLAIATARRFALAVTVPLSLLRLLSRAIDLLPRQRRLSRVWYALLYDHLYWRGVRRAMPRDQLRQLTGGTVILMYHACAAANERASRYVISRRRFARQMAWLKWRRYNVLSLDTYLEYRRGHRVPPSRSVVITFDDGYADIRPGAVPILRRHGFPATMFIVTNRAGTVSSWDEPRPLLSWTDLREMTADGIACGSHGRCHVALADVSADQAWDEIEGSRTDLEHALGCPVRLFSYPYGVTNAATTAMVARAGYAAACGIEWGLNDPATPILQLRRFEVRGRFPLWRFVLALSTGKAWLLRAPR